MDEKAWSPYCREKSVSDFLRCIGDASYAVMPKDIAHQVGELKKTVLGSVRSLIDKQIEWIDARIEGGDRLREDWNQARGRASDEARGSGI